MSIAAAPPIVALATPAQAAGASTHVRIEGTVVRVDRRGKQIFCFEGADLHKVGRGEVATVAFGGSTYRGELIAIAPTRAILHVSNARDDHGITAIA